MQAATEPALSPAATTFILHWGEMGARWGVNRTVAQVHALLYLSPEPLPAEEIADVLTIARSNVSTSLRELQNWNLVQVEHRMGDRRDFFRTSSDVWELFTIVVQQRVERELEPTLAMLQRCAAEAAGERPQRPEIAERISAMTDFITDLLDWYGKMRRLPAPTLRALMHLGTSITRWLPGAGKADKKGRKKK